MTLGEALKEGVSVASAADPVYSTLADFYDALKSDDSYDAWVDALLNPIRQFGTGGRRLLDVGCGTGLSSLAFHRRGFDVTGCDVASEMLEVARSKKESDAVEFTVADMRRLPDELGLFDVITWMDDVANHLLTPEDLRTAMQSSRERLHLGGVLVFDTNSLKVFASLSAAVTVHERPDSYFTLQGTPADPTPNGAIQLRFVGFLRDGAAWERRDVVVDERHYSGELIEHLLREADLELVTMLGWAGRQFVSPANETEHPKIVYVARPI